jgi:hypothetical protein
VLARSHLRGPTATGDSHVRRRRRRRHLPRRRALVRAPDPLGPRMVLSFVDISVVRVAFFGVAPIVGDGAAATTNAAGAAAVVVVAVLMGAGGVKKGPLLEQFSTLPTLYC